MADPDKDRKDAAGEKSASGYKTGVAKYTSILLAIGQLEDKIKELTAVIEEKIKSEPSLQDDSENAVLSPGPMSNLAELLLPLRDELRTTIGKLKEEEEKLELAKQEAGIKGGRRRKTRRHRRKHRKTLRRK
jgi:hypothetical protein